MFRDRQNPLEVSTAEEVKVLYRFFPDTIIQLTEFLTPELDHVTDRNCALPALLQVCIALRFFATGTFQVVVGDIIGIHKSTISRTVHRVSNLLAALKSSYIKLNGTEEEKQETKSGVYAIAGK